MHYEKAPRFRRSKLDVGAAPAALCRASLRYAVLKRHEHE